MKDRITIERRDGALNAYIARPKALPAPAVVVLHEVFGVNADIRKTCDELADAAAALANGRTIEFLHQHIWRKVEGLVT
jgi:dienelactone hydrolase